MTTSVPTYRVQAHTQSNEGWRVVSVQDQPEGASTTVGFATRERAQAEADRLNALAAAFEAGDGERRDEVLGRMLNTHTTQRVALPDDS